MAANFALDVLRRCRKAIGMMLSEWLALTGETKIAFGERIGVSPSTMTDLCRGTQWVSPRVAMAIERETGGAVTVADLLRAFQRARERAA